MSAVFWNTIHGINVSIKSHDFIIRLRHQSARVGWTALFGNLWVGCTKMQVISKGFCRLVRRPESPLQAVTQLQHPC